MDMGRRSANRNSIQGSAEMQEPAHPIGEDGPARLLDPRWGDAEDDASSPKQTSLLSIAGNLLVEVSLPKLLFSWCVLLVLPAMMLGSAPVVISAWFAVLSDHVLVLTEVGAVAIVIGIAVLGWFGWKPLFRMAEANFWSLNALAVQPTYAFGREGLRHLTEKLLAKKLTVKGRGQLRAASAVGAAMLISICALLAIAAIWTHARWTGGIIDFTQPHRLIVPAVANAAVLVLSYLAAAALWWGVADARMAQPVDRGVFDEAHADVKIWRVAHMSDLHAVGERYGFRIESGRAGPRGNERLERAIAKLAEIHAQDPIDYVLVTGDMTDAGRATEWAEFQDLVSRYPDLATRMLVVPGNHDVNVVDRANPARLDLPFSPAKRLRQVRMLAAITCIQGPRVQVIDDHGGQLSLTEALSGHLPDLVDFAEQGGIGRAARLSGISESMFPMIVPPIRPDGLGIALLDSNAETHFSFTNALGYVSLTQVHRLRTAFARHPDAFWIIALHHHLMEYPMPVKTFAERIGTALVNGSWFIRCLNSMAARCVVMHGHRHIDWIGSYGALKVVSAPSPVMGPIGSMKPYLYVHRLAAGPDGRLRLLEPHRIETEATEVDAEMMKGLG